MTARAMPDGASAAWHLTCDACFARLAGPAMAPWADLWRRAAVRGWRGSPHPWGAHRCPGCAGQR